MKKYILGFVLNGLMTCGSGPLIMAIVYAILNASGVVSEVSVSKIATEIISVTVLAFIAGGITVIHKVERIPLILGILIHGMVLYLDYIVIYLMNGWLKSGFLPLFIFTSCFVVGFAIASAKSSKRVSRYVYMCARP